MPISRDFKAAVLRRLHHEGPGLAPEADWAAAAMFWRPAARTAAYVKIPLELLANAQTKEYLTQQYLPEGIHRLQAHEAVLILPSWMASYDRDRDLSAVMRPSQNPDRIEILALSFACADAQELLLLEVLRDPRHHPRLRLDQELSDGAGGAIRGLIPEGLRSSFQRA